MSHQQFSCPRRLKRVEGVQASGPRRREALHVELSTQVLPPGPQRVDKDRMRRLDEANAPSQRRERAAKNGRFMTGACPGHGNHDPTTDPVLSRLWTYWPRVLPLAFPLPVTADGTPTRQVSATVALRSLSGGSLLLIGNSVLLVQFISNTR